VELLDLFDRTSHVIGRFPNREEAAPPASAAFTKRQPAPRQRDITGGPLPPGLQGRIFIIPPEGAGQAWRYPGK
jgi:hypothetical protein